jgi:iron complex outermembrane receptor protein
LAISNTRTRLLASSMITGIALSTVGFTQSANAADADTTATADSGAAVQELVVTGSRIPSKNLTSVSPITTVDNRDIKLEGAVNVEDFLNNLPQVFSDQGQYVSNGSTGIATVDLRNLGPKRTLVLIDGKRLQPGDPGGAGNDPEPDINFIPPQLIDRVEVLTGGASAVYGSDAVAGVVNFIMKKNFQGLEIDAETSIGEHENNNAQVRAANAVAVNTFGLPSLNLPSGATWAGQRHTVTIIGGVNSPDDKGNVEFYLGYTEIDPVLEGKYDYSTCSLSTNNTNSKQQYCGGSSTDATGRLTPETGPNKGANFNVLGASQPNGLIAPFSAGQDYNFGPLNYIQRPDTRYTAGYLATYNINKAINIYSSFMFMDDTSVAQVGPSGSFYAENNYTIPCDDPLLSVAQANTLCGPAPAGGYPAGDNASAIIGRRNVEGGGRTSALTHDDYRIVIGSKGDIGQGWTYDLSAQFGETRLTDIEGGYFLNSHLLNALDVIPGPGGTAVCASGVAGCVPYNIWSPGGITPAALAYLNGSAESSGLTTEQVVTATISNDLSHYGIKSPFATDGVGISLGLEYRREFLSTSYDSVIESGDLAGSGGAILNTSGSQSDKDVFGELRAPLIQDQPFIKSLTFETGYRYADYTSGGGNSTYKFALDWQVVPDIRFRGSFERAVRAPNVQELFSPLAPGLVSGSDPCAGPTPKYTAAQCFNTFTGGAPGVSEATFASTIYGQIPQCISGQCGDIAGGNPDLTPEIADTKSVGFVFTPTFFRGFSFTLDYFNINVQKAIVNLPLNLILNGCALDDLATDCALINRNPAAGYAIFGGGSVGSKGNVDTSLVNAGALITEGVDVEGSYRFSLPDMANRTWGSMTFHFEGTYVDKLVTELPGETYDCAGLYGTTCANPTPKWRHQFRISWNTPWNLALSMNWRYLSPTNLDFDTNQAALQNGFKDTLGSDAHIPAFNYFDLAFTYRIKDRYTFRGGINNIFDKSPPLLDSNSFGISAPPFGNANTYPQVFDPLGRVLFLGVTADF